MIGSLFVMSSQIGGILVVRIQGSRHGALVQKEIFEILFFFFDQQCLKIKINTVHSHPLSYIFFSPLFMFLLNR
jgi:hypothetical protein